ncbi:hypothetical protein LAV_00194 [Sphingobium phage Lacusarx]|uniref:Uncharacterized protein n=1 Tax=Sphingobium phage Lacusarx TaxID=1980139 RepID=A0A1W6DXF6_9CAUD|nr:hypothetical protein FDH44_gp109 [Sphingobium phage Lacusarx]ARK07569.1 hypothetical protein LAV_00194 [Sphingobium phage Lacusarx]
MFCIPVTTPFRFPESVITLPVAIPIDEIVVVKSLLDSDANIGVESDYHLISPRAEILFEDGRKLPIIESAAFVNQYLDGYRQLEAFYSAPAGAIEKTGVVIPLFQGSSCASSEASIPA